jgi:hypothetical protein
MSASSQTGGAFAARSIKTPQVAERPKRRDGDTLVVLEGSMSETTSTIALWLFVVNLGIAFGAGLYEDRIMLPRWISSSPQSGTHWNPEAARHDNSGLRFWVFVSTGPLTLITVINVIAAWQSTGAVRGWWLAAAMIALAERVFTFSYFIPTMIGLIGVPDSPAAVASATRWWSLNYLRHAMTLAAWLASLKVLSGRL